MGATPASLERYRETERRLWARLGIAPSDRRVTLSSGGRVRVQEVGTGPPVVFIHGGSIAGTSWCTLAAGLQDLRCILIDRPGCGLSDPIAGGPLRDLGAIEAYSDRFLADLLDASELETAAVAATSYGGLFAFRGSANAELPWPAPSPPACRRPSWYCFRAPSTRRGSTIPTRASCAREVSSPVRLDRSHAAGEICEIVSRTTHHPTVPDGWDIVDLVIRLDFDPCQGPAGGRDPGA